MAIPTTDPLDAVHAFLRQDFDTYHQLVAQVDSRQLGLATVTAFFLAASRVFEDGTIGDIIGFVARTRQRYDNTGDEYDPRAAERLIRAAAFDDEDLIDGIDQYTLGRVQTVMLSAMVEEARWDASELEEFLSEVRALMANR